MAKCSKCAKLVTKKSPGIQCGKCNKWLHGDCASLSMDQLNTLHSTDSVDWKCRNCTGNAKPKRLSCIVPETEDDDNTDSELPNQPSTTQMLSIIRREVRETIRAEIQTSLKFYADKIDDFEAKIVKYDSTMKTFEKQLIDVKNTCKNLALRNEVLEEKCNQIEQRQMADYIEICGITQEENENLQQIVEDVSTALNKKAEDIIKVYRKKQKKQQKNKDVKNSVIVLSLREGCRDQWMEAAKKTSLSTKDIGRKDDHTIYMREALTPATAFLLWKAKSELKTTGLWKYVWCRNGTVLAKKGENEDDKTFPIKSLYDIDKLMKEIKK